MINMVLPTILRGQKKKGDNPCPEQCLPDNFFKELHQREIARHPNQLISDCPDGHGVALQLHASMSIHIKYH